MGGSTKSWGDKPARWASLPQPTSTQVWMGFLSQRGREHKSIQAEEMLLDHKVRHVQSCTVGGGGGGGGACTVKVSASGGRGGVELVQSRFQLVGGRGGGGELPVVCTCVRIATSFPGFPLRTSSAGKRLLDSPQLYQGFQLFSIA